MAGKTHRIGKSLIEIQKTYGAEEQCLAFLQMARWPDGVECVKCGGRKISKFTTKEGKRKRFSKKEGKVVEVAVPARHLYTCLNTECGQQFSVVAGTVFNDSHLPLTKWFEAIALMLNAKKGLSAKQMERDLGVSYKTAWYLCHRIRKAMDEGTSLFTGIVEADETFIGGQYDKRRNRGPFDKQPVFGALQRGSGKEHSRVRAFPVPSTSRTVLTGAVTGTVSTEAKLFITDEARGYVTVGKQYHHERVNHIALEYVRKGDPRSIHTNSIEGFWSLFKRGLIGSFHKVSVKHLGRYLNEFEFRFNHRKNEELFAMTIINLLIASALPYAELTANPQACDQTASDEPF